MIYFCFVLSAILSSITKLVGVPQGRAEMVKPTQVTNDIRSLRFRTGEMTQAELAEATRRDPPDRHRHRAGPVLALARDGLPDRAGVRGPARRGVPVPRRRGDGVMSAAVYERYGAPEVVRIQERDEPATRGGRGAGAGRGDDGRRGRERRAQRQPLVRATVLRPPEAEAPGARYRLRRAVERVGEGVTPVRARRPRIRHARARVRRARRVRDGLRSGTSSRTFPSGSTRPRRSRRSTASSPRCRSSATWRTCRRARRCS